MYFTFTKRKIGEFVNAAHYLTVTDKLLHLYTFVVFYILQLSSIIENKKHRSHKIWHLKISIWLPTFWQDIIRFYILNYELHELLCNGIRNCHPNMYSLSQNKYAVSDGKVVLLSLLDKTPLCAVDYTQSGKNTRIHCHAFMVTTSWDVSLP